MHRAHRMPTGPLTITVAAGGWHDYESGIFDKVNEVRVDPTTRSLIEWM
jgi:hypothetical protein